MTQCARTNFASSLGTTGCLFNLELLDNSRAIGGTTCGENMSKYALFPWMYPLPGWRGIDSTPWGIAAALGPDPPNICRYCVEFQKRTGDGIAFNRAFRQARRERSSGVASKRLPCHADRITSMSCEASSNPKSICGTRLGGSEVFGLLLHRGIDH